MQVFRKSRDNIQLKELDQDFAYREKNLINVREPIIEITPKQKKAPLYMLPEGPYTKLNISYSTEMENSFPDSIITSKTPLKSFNLKEIKSDFESDRKKKVTLDLSGSNNRSMNHPPNNYNPMQASRKHDVNFHKQLGNSQQISNSSLNEFRFLNQIFLDALHTRKNLFGSVLNNETIRERLTQSKRHPPLLDNKKNITTKDVINSF